MPSFRILIVADPIKKSSDGFGIAPNFDYLGSSDFIKMVIVGDWNRISVEACRSVNDIRDLAVWEECSQISISS